MSKKNIIILISLVLLIPVSIAALTLVSEIKGRIVDNLVGQYTTVAESTGKQVAATLATQFYGLQDKLTIATQIPQINNGDIDSCTESLTKIVSTVKIKINNLGRIGPDGLFSCSLNKALIGLKASNFGSYITDIFNDPEHNAVLSRKVKVPNVDGNVVALHVPVFDTDHNFTGTFGGAIYFNDLKTNFLNDISIAEGGYIAIIDDNGDILSHPDPTIEGKNFYSEEIQALVNNNESYTNSVKDAAEGIESIVRYTLNGQEKVGVLIPIEIFPGRYWIVNATIPLESIKNAVNANQVESLFNALLGIIIIFIIVTPIVLVIYLIRSVFNPMNKIITSMSKVSGGNFEEEVKYKGSPKDEIFLLTNSFNEMVKKLKKSYTILEETVSSRTKELTGAKKQLEKTVDQRTKELEEAKADLEKKVIDRTKELEAKLEELELFNNAAIDREMKMIELKKELETLKSKQV